MFWGVFTLYLAVSFHSISWPSTARSSSSSVKSCGGGGPLSSSPKIKRILSAAGETDEETTNQGWERPKNTSYYNQTTDTITETHKKTIALCVTVIEITAYFLHRCYLTSRWMSFLVNIHCVTPKNWSVCDTYFLDQQKQIELWKPELSCIWISQGSFHMWKCLHEEA